MATVAAASVAELAALLHGVDNPWKALAMFTSPPSVSGHAFYGDESNIHQGARVTAVAGYVATAEAWQSLAREWAAIMAKVADRGVTWFHMVDCVHGDGQFACIPGPERDNLIAFLAGVINRHDVTAIWCGIINEEFERLTASESEFRKRFPKAYDLCFDEVIRQIWLWGGKNAGGSRIPVIFAEQKEFEAHNRQAYQAWRNHPGLGLSLGSLTFDLPRHVVPLQAADMLAYEAAKEWDHRQFGADVRPMAYQQRPVFDAITRQNGAFNGGLYGATALRTAVAKFNAEGQLWGH